MIVAISSFAISNEKADELASRFRRRSRKVDAHTGFLGLEVLSRVSRGETGFLLVSRWTSHEALRAYLRSGDFRAVHRGSVEQDADFAVYEVVSN